MRAQQRPAGRNAFCVTIWLKLFKFWGALPNHNVLGEFSNYCPGVEGMLTPGSRILPGNSGTCTTTTTVTTTTTTTTGTSTTLTTAVQVQRRCEDICESNGHPWFMKCVWEICATCLQCTNVIPPKEVETPAPATITITTTSASTSTSTTHTTSTTSTSTSTTPPPPPATTTVTTEQSAYCLDQCFSASSVDWSMKCEWELCWECSMCDPTTTTATTTTTTSTSTTSQSTTTTTCDFCLVTTTATTTTVTTVTTTTTTTTNIACQPPSRVYPVAGCVEPVAAGDTCVTETINHPCVEEETVIFHCPADNIDPLREPDLVVSDKEANVSAPRVRCRVCDLSPGTVSDTDPRSSKVAGIFTFGPNAVEGYVDQTDILEYHIVFVDRCGLILDEPILVLPVNVTLASGCCTPGAYTASFKGDVPVNHSGNLTLMVVPYTDSAGLLTAGQVAGDITDWFDAEKAYYYGKVRSNLAIRWCGATVTGGFLVAGATSMAVLLAVISA
eukprot:TRINITY_DN4346_c0_g1_i1.p1 TRINITY_DN4346_c0_g1~~TRINITY_DN4346_c0_g1_i1.p1  ORF type:complete len:500 (-),score=51.33 TRINITY_DN4346_c0_g1_i1:75-1574(-)